MTLLKRHPILYSTLFFCLSLCVLLHLFELLHRQKSRELELVLRAEHLPPELCLALEDEECFLLDGRFALYKTEAVSSPTLLRFYDAADQCEFTVPSKKYSDVEITLHAVAREHPFGMALYGVRTVNVGMHLSLFGQRCKIYALCTELRVPTCD